MTKTKIKTFLLIAVVLSVILVTTLLLIKNIYNPQKFENIHDSQTAKNIEEPDVSNNQPIKYDGNIVCNLYSEPSSGEPGKLDRKSCFCKISSKNKIAIIVKQKSIYDNQEIEEALNSYFVSVKKDLGIDSTGIIKFSGATIDELDKLIESLNLNNNVKYFILVGEDLPVFESPGNLNLIWEKLEYVGRSYSVVKYAGPGSENLPEPAMINDCKDVAISTVPGPTGDTTSKIEFIKKVFDNFTWMHNNYNILKNIYGNKVLSIEWDKTLGMPVGENTNLDFYTLPQQKLKNSEHEKIQNTLKEQPAILAYLVHGSPYVIGIGLGSKEYDKFNTSIEEYRTFFEINNIKSPLLIDAFTCGSAWPVAWENPENTEFCCWPQTSLDTGAWVYYGASGSFETIGSVIREVSNGKTIGEALLIKPHFEFKIYGDILAHLPIFK